MKWFSKIFIGLFVFGIATSTFAKTSLNEGGYGSNTLYCGLEIVSDPRNDNLIVTYIHNPAFTNVSCNVYGRSVIYYYDAGKDYFNFSNGADKYCVLKAKNAGSFVQSCFFKVDNSLANSVRYTRYY